MKPTRAVIHTGLTCGLLAATVLVAPSAGADDPNWAGRYQITFHTDQKTGTSMAAGQQETPYTASYLFTTECGDDGCLAKAVDGPVPKDNVSAAVSFEWTGAQWEKSRDWRWDCLLPDGTITYDPATSVTVYRPQPDGTLTGSFDTTIDSGDCAGTISIPVTARQA